MEEGMICTRALEEAPLSRKYVLFYGVGHMLNDLTAACWFTYLLIYLTDIGLSSRESAAVMLSGQFADGIATISVGQLIDLFGHFKWWHAGGSILVAISFSSVFGGCLVCSIFHTRSFLLQTVGYAIFAAIFNIGWAATQVSHMSVVNCITSNSTSRVALASCRNAFTMVANLLLFTISFTAFKLLPAENVNDVEYQYRWIAGAAITIGFIFVMVFLFGVKEPSLQHLSCRKDFQKTSFCSWFKKLLYYQVAFVYMLTRLATNVSQSLLAFYLVYDLCMEESSKAVVPAVIFMSSFFASVWLQESEWSGSRVKALFMGGAVLWVLSGATFLVLPRSWQALIYVLAVVVGAANALMLVTATSMESILVGEDLSGCAFVYGSLSLLDKFSCGIALYVIQAAHVEESSGYYCSRGQALPVHSSKLIRNVLGLLPGGCALVAAIITAYMKLDDRLTICESLNEPLIAVHNKRGMYHIENCDISRDRVCHASAENLNISAYLKAVPPLYRRLTLLMVGRWG